MKFFCIILVFVIFLSCNKNKYSPNEIRRCLSSLSLEEKEYFQKIVYWDYKQLKKWNKNIYVSVEGNDIREGDQMVIDEIIKEVSTLINPLKIERAEEDNANLVFKLNSNLPNSNHAYGQANSRFKYFDVSAVDYTEILIFPSSRGYHRKRVMFHEMMHALGMNHPESDNGTRIFYDSRLSPYNLNSYDEADHEKYLSENYKFSDLDRKIIRALYRSCIPRGISKGEMEKIIF